MATPTISRKREREWERDGHPHHLSVGEREREIYCKIEKERESAKQGSPVLCRTDLCRAEVVKTRASRVCVCWKAGERVRSGETEVGGY